MFAAWNAASIGALEKMMHSVKTTDPMERFCCYHCARMMSNRNLNSTEKAMGILRILYPDADEYALERNLYFPLKRCLQIQPDICAGFPDCMCGRDALEQSGIDPDSARTAPQEASGGPGLF